MQCCYSYLLNIVESLQRDRHGSKHQKGRSNWSLHSNDAQGYMTPSQRYRNGVISFVYINYKETLFLFGASSHPYIPFYTKVGTLGEMCMRGTANWWAGLFTRDLLLSSWRVWHWLATVEDSMRESIHALRCDFLCLQGTQSKRTRWR